jgi:hypothetical protein
LAVSSTARRRCQAERTKLLSTRLRQTLAEAVQSGLDAKAINDLVRAELSVVRRQQKQ